MKNSWKKTVALLLCLALVFSLAACSGKESGAPESKTPDSSAADASSGEASGESAGTDSSEPVELSVVLITDGMEYPSDDAMEEEFNKIVREKLNVNVTFKRVSFFDFSTTMNLWMSSGESCDIFEPFLEWSNYIQQGYLLDLTGYQDHMQDAIKTVERYMVNGYAGDTLYGIPSLKDMVNLDAYFFRKDMVEETGIDPAGVTTFEAMGDLMRAIKAKYPDILPLSGDANNAVLHTAVAFAEDGRILATNNLQSDVGALLMDPANSSQVSCMYFGDAYEKLVNLAYEWNQEGLMKMSDMSSGPEQVMAESAAGGSGMYKPGGEAEWSTNTGHEMVAVCMAAPSDAVLATNNTWNWSVNANCEAPERACELLNLMFTDKELNNLMAWGVEGTDYEQTGEENVIKYPEGTDSTNASYYNWAKFGLPNSFLQYVMAPNPSDLWEQTQEFDGSAKRSVAYGFSYVKNDDAINGKITEIKNIVSEYNPGLSSGELDPSTALPEFREKLTAAGIDDVIAHVQKQLDEFLAAQ